VKNPLWGTPRIQCELALLGYVVAESTVDAYRIRPRQPPSQTWRSFLDNHVRDIVAVDFFTAPTATFRILFCFLVLRHERRISVSPRRLSNSFAGQVRNESTGPVNASAGIQRRVDPKAIVRLGCAPCRAAEPPPLDREKPRIAFSGWTPRRTDVALLRKLRQRAKTL